MQSTPKVSAVVIAFNDEPNMRPCLESIRWADEIVVVDSYSTDGTAKIAGEFTDRVFQQAFEGFGKLRNQAISHATNDWIFSLDTDERATPEIRDEIRTILARGPELGAYFVPRKNYFQGRWIRHCGWYPDYRQPQLFNRQRFRYREDLVHEGFESASPPGRLKEHVLQYPFRNIGHFLSKMDRYSELMAKRLDDRGCRFRTHQLITHPASTFLKMYVVRLGVLDGLPGFVLSGLYAYYTFIKYVRLWERTRR